MLRGVLWNANIPSLAEPLRSGGLCLPPLVGGHPSGHMKSSGNIPYTLIPSIHPLFSPCILYFSRPIPHPPL